MSHPDILTFYSSQTEALIDSLLYQLEQDESSAVNTPFGHTTIVVPNSGMQRYLELQIAERFGICSHITIGYVGQVVAASYRSLLDAEASAHLDQRTLTFALLNLWGQGIYPLDQHFSRLLEQHRQPRQRYLFASHTAKLLRQYINERPEMIDAWQQGKLATQHPHESWQRDVLSQLLRVLETDYTPRHILHQQFEQALAHPDAAEVMRQSIGSKLHLFGFHALPTSQLADVIALSQAIPAVFYTFNPCLEYWLDIVPEKLKQRLEITRADEAALMCVGHPLLASWGLSGKSYINQLNEFYAPHLDEMVPVQEPRSLLGWLQRDIRTLQNDDHAEDFNKYYEQECDSSLPSISLHACASPRREVEVLYDNLCSLFASGDIRPSDVIVIVPQLQRYAPHIHAIFSRSGATSERAEIRIPYSLANQSSAETDADVQAFIALLDVINSDFQAQALFEVLNEVRVQQALSLEQSYVDTIRQWFFSSRFSRNFYDASEYRSSSFEKLLDGMVLAHVGGEHAELGLAVASSEYYDGQDDALAKLCELWQRFVPCARMASQQQSLSAWRDSMRSLCAAFLPDGHAMDEWINRWYEPVSSLDERSLYSFATIRADYLTLLQSDALHGPFLSGGVSFCAAQPMRCIPSACIAVLGMNSDFPNVSTKDPLDIRLDTPLWSDSNPHREQKYFFLETLMAARQKLYVSYVGIDERTGESQPPSTMITEMMSYLERQHQGCSKSISTSYPLQGFMSENSFQTLYEATPHNGATVEISDEQDHDSEPALPAVITTTQLSACIQQPLDAFMRFALGASDITRITEPLLAYECIAPETGLDTWKYRYYALDDERTGHTLAAQSLQRENRYAPPVISDVLLARAGEHVEPLAQVLRALYGNVEPEQLSVSCEHRYAGQALTIIDSVYYHAQNGLLHYYVGKLDEKKYLRSWLSHVVYHCQKDVVACDSRLLTLDKGAVTETTFRAFSCRDDAIHVLDGLLKFVMNVIHAPYPAALVFRGKKEVGTLCYRAAEVNVYSEIGNMSSERLDELQQLWQEIDELITEYDGGEQ